METERAGERGRGWGREGERAQESTLLSHGLRVYNPLDTITQKHAHTQTHTCCSSHPKPLHHASSVKPQGFSQGQSPGASTHTRTHARTRTDACTHTHTKYSKTHTKNTHLLVRDEEFMRHSRRDTRREEKDGYKKENDEGPKNDHIPNDKDLEDMMEEINEEMLRQGNGTGEG